MKENPETCDKIETMIIDGYRPSLDIPDDTLPCSIDTKPSKRPSLGKIISVLTIILQQEIRKYLPSIESTYEMKQMIIGKNLSTNLFSKGYFGLVMICEFHLDGKIFGVDLKMLNMIILG